MDTEQVLKHLWDVWVQRVAVAERIIPARVWRPLADQAARAYQRADILLLAEQIKILKYMIAAVQAAQAAQTVKEGNA